MKLTIFTITAGMTHLVQAAIIHNYDTGADGLTPGSVVFASGGSWAGDGTVQPFLADLGNPANSAPSAQLLDDFSGGTLSLTNAALAGTSSPYTPAGFGSTHTISIADGTADLTGIFTGGAGSGSNNHNFSLTPSAGSTHITYSVSYTDALHSRRRTGANLLPWLGSLQMPGSANVTVTYGGVFTATSTDGTILNATTSLGIAGGISSSTISGRDFGGAANVMEPSPGTLTYFQTAGSGNIHLNSIIPADPGNIHNNSSTGAYAAGPMGDANLNDGERVFGDTITWSIKPDGAAFTGSEVFIISLDGGLGNVPVGIPEPTATAILALATLSFLGRRKRV